MEYCLKYFERTKHFYTVFIGILVGVGLVKLTAIPSIPSIVPTSILISTFLFVFLSKKILYYFFSHDVRFTINDSTMLINDDRLNTFHEFVFLVEEIDKYKISLVNGGKKDFINLKLVINNGTHFIYSFEKNKQSLNFIEKLNSKILKQNQLNQGQKNIELMPSFFNTPFGLITLKVIISFSILLIIYSILFVPKVTIGSVLILTASIIQLFVLRKSDQSLREKLLTGQPISTNA